MIDYFWLMDHLEWFVFILIATTIVLLIFPIILGYDLKKELEDDDHKNMSNE